MVSLRRNAYCSAYLLIITMKADLRVSLHCYLSFKNSLALLTFYKFANHFLPDLVKVQANSPPLIIAVIVKKPPMYPYFCYFCFNILYPNNPKKVVETIPPVIMTQLVPISTSVNIGVNPPKTMAAKINLDKSKKYFAITSLACFSLSLASFCSDCYFIQFPIYNRNK